MLFNTQKGNVHCAIKRKRKQIHQIRLGSLEKFNSLCIKIPFPHFRHATDSLSAEYVDDDNGAEHHHRLNSIRPDDRFQATL